MGTQILKKVPNGDPCGGGHICLLYTEAPGTHVGAVPLGAGEREKVFQEVYADLKVSQEVLADLKITSHMPALYFTKPELGLP